jgi:CheY-like chemotaxis protein
MHPTTSHLPTRSLRVLVLDGDDTAARVLRGALEARHCSVVTASDGTAGLELLLAELLELDALVMDVGLPHRDARAFADLIRRAGGERDLAIVVLAHEPGEDLRSELLAAGVDAVVARSAGPGAAADAAIEAVRSRAASRDDAPEPPAPALTDSPAPPASWALSLARWSLVPA